MPIDEAKFTRLTNLIMNQIEFSGFAPPRVPVPRRPRPEELQKLIAEGAPYLPLQYHDEYIVPLRQNMGLLQRSLIRGECDRESLLAMMGAIHEHSHPWVAPQLHRFLAVVSNLYRSFLSSKRRGHAGFRVLSPSQGQVPPLAAFQYNNNLGPFTLTAEDVDHFCHAKVGIVSLPSRYRNHPVLWAALAHETGGHDVLHADPGLVDEMKEKMVIGDDRIFDEEPPSLGKKMSLNQFLGLLWAHWLEEAASDVYGVLNIGPAFGHNLALWFAAWNSQAVGARVPTLRTTTVSPGTDLLDEHPTDILRLHLVIGVIDSMSGLAEEKRQEYIADIERLSEICATGRTEVRFRGLLPTGQGRRIPINVTLPLKDMQQVARKVGEFLASVPLQAFAANDGPRSIQQLETWDDDDEASVLLIRNRLLRHQGVANMGDDAQLLAAATLAIFEQPSLYQSVSRQLEQALTASFNEDPFWGVLSQQRIFVGPRLTAEDFIDIDLDREEETFREIERKSPTRGRRARRSGRAS